MKLGAAAKLVSESIDETLGYYAFPSQHWLKIKTNNPMERLLREARRRTKVVGAFSDGQSALMLVAARLRHVSATHWGTRKYMSMKLLDEITMDVYFCLEALEEALARYGAPEIMNTDQGSQFTSLAFTSVLQDDGIQISMDGKGAWRDNIFVERLWRTVKYEEVYLHAYDTVSDARNALRRYFDLYNQRRPHSSLGRRTPDQVYFSQQPLTQAA